MAKFLYNALLHLALPWVWARLFWKADGAYRRRIGERFGRVPADVAAGAVWFHTVSAGEANAAAPIIRALLERCAGEPVLVTTMTPAGSARVRALLGDAVAHCYAPYDYPWAVARFVTAVRPRALVLVETELWPNLIEQASRAGAAIYLVNARLSARSFRGYRRVAPISRPMLRRLDAVLCQYEDTAARFRQLGARRVETTGSVKFDAALPPDSFGVRALPWDGAPTWIAGSTHPGEEEVILDAHRQLLRRLPNLRLIVAPRHTERAAAVARLARERGFGVAFLSERGLRCEGQAPRAPLRCEGQAPRAPLTCEGQAPRAPLSCEGQAPRAPRLSAPAFQVLVVDVMGTLPHLYGLAQVAFVGGSLDRTGGHNPIEAAAQGLPLVLGPARFKIEEICARFLAADCLHTVTGADDLAQVVGGLLTDTERRDAEGRRAKAVVEENRGATQAVVERLCEWLEPRAQNPDETPARQAGL